MGKDRKYNASKIMLVIYVLTFLMYLYFEYDIVMSAICSVFDVTFVSLIMLFIPFIVKCIKKDYLSYKKGKILCIMNSIILYLISVALYVYIEISFVSGITAVLYYFVNKHLFVEYKN